MSGRVMRLRPKIDDHGLATKARRVGEWLRGGDVDVVVMLRGREAAHPELAAVTIARLARLCGARSTPPRQDGRNVSATLSRDEPDALVGAGGWR